MKFGANLWIWDSPVTTNVISHRAPHVKSLGFDIVEIPLEQTGSWDPQLVRRVLDDLALGVTVCVAMSPGRDLATDDPQTVRDTQTYLQHAIEAAADLGSPCVAGPIYSPTGRTGVISDEQRERRLHVLADNLQPVLKTARDHHVRLAIEPLNRFETSLFNTVDQTLVLLDLLADTSAGMLLDTFHMNIEERDMIAAIRLAGDHLFHFHACGNDRGAPGNGSVPWPEIAAVLTDIGYNGAVVIESFAGGNQVIAKAASIWRPLAPTQDRIAIDGLGLLRSVFNESPAS